MWENVDEHRVRALEGHYIYLLLDRESAHSLTPTLRKFSHSHADKLLKRNVSEGRANFPRLIWVSAKRAMTMQCPANVNDSMSSLQAETQLQGDSGGGVHKMELKPTARISMACVRR